MKLCFASNNEHKLTEVRQILAAQYEILSLQDIGCHEELPEEQETLEGNSHQKANHVWQHYNISCFADDTGLEVMALNGEPGVYSARYAGAQRSNHDNMQLLLQKLEGNPDRRAQFRTSITLILDGQVNQFNGIVTGTIAQAPSGEKGFGYDPIFIPDGFNQTFAQMGSEQKNSISHRGRALQALAAFLKNYNTQ
ncbi:non-canonical purine NTP diphosphatase [Adhaeribacter rhizoryzae]|uniref:dITP/XTP pyrophosphatase n=1 Tax=Adhaeribacter rhizoryzae TaxID=2607907 RepID=A0A5M6DVI5_9BACT|nr:non-canonical purine NTP diphosphatase [Adhaeribacter rhizoryzae]KAA5549485.1 non-canonical purine NTP diphosphatase [Adhaeribacter rhizoryzae]